MLLATYVTTLALLAVFALHRLYLTILSTIRRKTPLPCALEPAAVPLVTVQLPLFNERYVAERAIAAIGALVWPRDRLELQVLDDSTDDTRDQCDRAVAALRAQGFDAKVIRRAVRAGFKAGALEHGRAEARGDFHLVLDADFVADPGLLERAMGYFADDRVGMVQLAWRHQNRRASLLTRAQAMLLDGHFGVEQQARARHGRFFNFNGTAGIWRARAVQDAGGWQADTVTEDFDLSYRALLCGWRFVFVEGRGVDSELPGDLNAFRSQQYRWAKGSVQVARKLLGPVWRAPLSLSTKVDATFHLLQNLPYLLTCVLAMLVVPVVAFGTAADAALLEPLHLSAAVITLVTLGAYFAAAAHHLRQRPWRAVLLGVPLVIGLTFAMSVHQMRAVLAGACLRGGEFVRTAKHGADAVRGRWRRSQYRGASSKGVAFELLLAAWIATGLAGGGAAISPLVATSLAAGSLALLSMALASVLRR